MNTEQPQRPTDDNREAWHAYWTVQGMPWRTEPEIDDERQQFLAERRAIPPDIEKSIYPFRDECGGIQLTRADVEWLLATHESGGMRGPVDWTDTSQRERKGLDLRGADLQGDDLRDLPLARLRGGLLHWSQGSVHDEWYQATSPQRDAAAIHLAHAVLSHAHLEGASLSNGRFEGADMRSVHLEGARMHEVHLGGAKLNGAYLDRATNEGVA